VNTPPDPATPLDPAGHRDVALTDQPDAAPYHAQTAQPAVAPRHLDAAPHADTVQPDGAPQPATSDAAPYQAESAHPAPQSAPQADTAPTDAAPQLPPRTQTVLPEVAPQTGTAQPDGAPYQVQKVRPGVAPQPLDAAPATGQITGPGVAVPAPAPYQPQYLATPAPFQIPAMNAVWSQEDARHPAASTRRRWRHDPYWWLWPAAGLAIGIFLGVLAYGLFPASVTTVCIDGVACGPARKQADLGTVLILLSCAWGAFGLAFLLPHRWVWLWLRVPLSLAGIVLAVLCGSAA